jgi:hypothetical protein
MRSGNIGGLAGAGAAVMAIALILGASGCASNSGDGSWADDPTTRAMADPMNYSPPDDSDISGGGIADFNSKAFHKDMDHVVNP